MKIDVGTERAATLHIGCSSDRDGGAVVIELTVPDANTKQDFGYNDFEGPDSPAGALSHLEWITAGGKTSITAKAAGSYIPEPPEAFQFGIDELSHRHSPGATLLASVKSEPGKLIWAQSSYGKSKQKLMATFDFAADEAKHIHDIVAACLPKSELTDRGIAVVAQRFCSRVVAKLSAYGP
jgi:hypothetical protein